MSADLPDHDKRFFRRRLLRVAARVILNGNAEFEVRTSDVSEGGLGLVAAANPRVGTRFRVIFAIPNGSLEPVLIDTQVTVVRSILAQDEGGFKIGLLFPSLDEGSAKAIKRYVNRT